MKTEAVETPNKIQNSFLSTDTFLKHWQGHRKLTRRVIEAFPEDKLFTYSVAGMRPFSELALEMLGMAVPGIVGVASGEWKQLENPPAPASKAELLKLWDETTEQMNELWATIPHHRFAEVEAAFGQYEAPNYQTILYFIDNEIHHRAQGYVYLRSLGIEPPYFWER